MKTNKTKNTMYRRLFSIILLLLNTGVLLATPFYFYVVRTDSIPIYKTKYKVFQYFETPQYLYRGDTVISDISFYSNSHEAITTFNAEKHGYCRLESTVEPIPLDSMSPHFNRLYYTTADNMPIYETRKKNKKEIIQQIGILHIGDTILAEDDEFHKKNYLDNFLYFDYKSHKHAFIYTMNLTSYFYEDSWAVPVTARKKTTIKLDDDNIFFHKKIKLKKGKRFYVNSTYLSNSYMDVMVVTKDNKMVGMTSSRNIQFAGLPTLWDGIRVPFFLLLGWIIITLILFFLSDVLRTLFKVWCVVVPAIMVYVCGNDVFWFCDHDLIGWFWAFLGVILAILFFSSLLYVISLCWRDMHGIFHTLTNLIWGFAALAVIIYAGYHFLQVATAFAIIAFVLSTLGTRTATKATGGDRIYYNGNWIDGHFEGDKFYSTQGTFMRDPSQSDEYYPV